MNIYSFFAASFALIGQLGLIYKQTWAFYFWCLSNFIWIYVSLTIRLDYSQFIMNVVFVILNIISIVTWRKKND